MTSASLKRKAKFQRKPGASKRCGRCKQVLSVEKFYRAASSPDGFQYRCKQCSREHQNEWSKEFPDKVAGYALQSRYGISTDGYYEMLEQQGGGCAICGRPPKARRLCVDHDHTTGEIRGLLCPGCNYAVSVIESYPVKLEAYLA